MMNVEKILTIILALTMALTISLVVVAAVSTYTHRDCVCLEHRLQFNGKFWVSTCSKWEHHHKELEQ